MKTSLHLAATPQHRARRRVNNRTHPKTSSSGQHPRRRFLHLVVGTAALPATTRLAWAQSFPTRPITMIVSVAAGSVSDVIGRTLAERMRASLGQPIIIENVSGGEGIIGTRRAARATPDGYTIANGINSTHALNGAFYSLPYDVLDDFEPISPVITIPLVLFAGKRCRPTA